ncbi:MAG TPA: 2-dehydropantoate 2-reductase [Sphingobium sp.]|nr:2-dehydropantoate 2-reductase [Sphingobium sp.]
MSASDSNPNEPLRICVYGLGAIGGHAAVKLARAGADVCAIARGETLNAIAARGLTLRAEAHADMTVPLKVASDAEAFGVQDVVVIAVKLPALPEVLRKARPLIGPDTAVIFMMNGMPWWFMEGLPLGFDKEPVYRMLDGTGELRGLLPIEQWVHCSISSGNRVLEPGLVLNESPGHNRMKLGYWDGRRTAVLDRFAALAAQGGYEAEAVSDIRRPIWGKLLINAGISATSAIVERNVHETVSDPDTRSIVVEVMREILAIGEAIGIRVEADPVAMTDPANVPPHVTSFLQDLQAGRRLEISNGILGVREIARARGVAAPHLETVAALLASRSEVEARAREG